MSQRSPRPFRWLTAVLVPLLLAPIESAAAVSTADAVKAIQVSGEPPGTIVRIWTDGDLEDVSYQRLANPARLVIDFPGLASALASDRIEVGSAHVARIRAGRHSDKVRVVIDSGASDMRKTW